MPTKFCVVKAMVFPDVMYGSENLSIRKAECRRIHAFELWCWRRLLRIPWTARRSNQWVVKEINPEYSSLFIDAKAGTPKVWPPDVKTWFAGKAPDAGKDSGQEEKRVREDEMVGGYH